MEVCQSVSTPPHTVVFIDLCDETSITDRELHHTKSLQIIWILMLIVICVNVPFRQFR